MTERKLPPVTQLGALSLAFVAVGVIYLAAYLPKRAPLSLAVVFLALAVAALLANGLLLARAREFAWWRFFRRPALGRVGLRWSSRGCSSTRSSTTTRTGRCSRS